VLAGGIGLAITLAGKLYEALQSGEQEATKDLEEHTRLLGRKAYDDAGQSVDGFAKNLSAVVRFQAEMNLQKMTADLAALARATVRSQTYVPAAAQGTLDLPLPADVPMAVPDVELVRPEFAAFADAIRRFDEGGLENSLPRARRWQSSGLRRGRAIPNWPRRRFTVRHPQPVGDERVEPLGSLPRTSRRSVDPLSDDSDHSQKLHAMQPA
jgi:hypothetical protein